MSSEKHILPIDDESFREDAINFFSLTTESVMELVNQLEERGTLFSAASVARILKGKILDARDKRLTLLALIRIVGSNKDQIPKIAYELKSIGCKEDRIGPFLARLSTLNGRVVALSNYLLSVSFYTTQLTHLKSVEAEFNYSQPSLVSAGHVLLFPKVHLTIATHQTEGREEVLDFEISADEFEAFVINLNEILTSLREESEVLKREFGDRFTGLIG